MTGEGHRPGADRADGKAQVSNGYFYSYCCWLHGTARSCAVYPSVSPLVVHVPEAPTLGMENTAVSRTVKMKTVAVPGRGRG